MSFHDHGLRLGASRDGDVIRISGAPAESLTAEDIERLRECQDKFRHLGAQAIAIGRLDGLCQRVIGMLRLDPIAEGRSLIGLSNTIRTYGQERAAHGRAVRAAFRITE
jgi:hypothetical protein